MITADSLGLLPYLRWIEGRNFWITLSVCLTITPGVMIVIAPILESRWLPLDPTHQYVGFFPGDIFLSVTTACLLAIAQQLPKEERFYNTLTWHTCIQTLTLFAAVSLTYLGQGDRPAGEYYSPTRIYHNVALYGVYSYIVMATLVAVIVGSSWNWEITGWFALSIVAGIVWVILIIQDNSLTPEQSQLKQTSVHVTDWHPIWRR